MSDALKLALQVIWRTETPEAEAIRRAICAARISTSENSGGGCNASR